ncbi:MAG TPA: DUF6448 family protein [Candidatus Polarisedimenticolaceae bacterium]
MKYIATLFVGLASVFGCAGARAHCDTLEGPVLVDARLALEKGDVTPVLKWVMAAKEPEIRKAFDSTLAVRTKGPEARDLADRYFFETLVRVHREGEGAPYTGIKDEPVEPIVAMADKAIAGGSHEAMTRAIVGHLTSEIDAKYRRVLEASKTKDTSVAAGREFVEAYVIYVHYVEGVHDAIAAAGGHEGHAK